MTQPAYMVLDYGTCSAQERVTHMLAVRGASKRMLAPALEHDETVGTLLDACMSIYLSLVDMNPGVAPVARMCLDGAARHLDNAADAGLQTMRLLNTLKTNPNGERNV